MTSPSRTRRAMAKSNKRLKKLRIPEAHVTRALLLIRNFRIQTIKEELDPRATRIAILFAEMSDTHFCTRKLHPVTMAALEQIARDYFNMTLFEFEKDKVRRT